MARFPQQSGSGGGISQITSTGATVTVTNAFGPVTDLEVSGAVTSVTPADTSVVVTPTTGAVTVATGTLDAVANNHLAAANWSNNSHKITSLANGTAATDAAAFGQIPTATNLPYTITRIGTSQTAGANQVYICTATLTLTLPGSPAVGQWVTVKLIAASSTVTIAGTVDTIVSPTITTQFQSDTIVWDGTVWNFV